MQTFKALLALASCAAMVTAEVVHARDGAYKADNYKCTPGEVNCKADGTYCRPGATDCKYDSNYDNYKDDNHGEIHYDDKKDGNYCKPDDPNCKYSEKKYDDKYDDKQYGDKKYDGNYGYKEGEHKYDDKKYDDKAYDDKKYDDKAYDCKPGDYNCKKPDNYGHNGYYEEGGKYDDKSKCYSDCYKECCNKCDYKPNYEGGLKDGYKHDNYGYGDKCRPNFQGKYFSIFNSDSDSYKDDYKNQKDYKQNYWCWKGENKDGGYISVYPCEKELWGHPGKWIIEFTGKDNGSYNIKLVENTERNLKATKSHEDKLIMGSYGGYAEQFQIKCDKCSYEAKSFTGCTISNDKYCVTSKWEDGHALTFEHCDEKSNYQRWNFVDQTCKEDEYFKGDYYRKDEYRKPEVHY